MGVMSRRVVPVCGSLCCFCPSLRARSRQPVKRYKTLLADIFPKAQDAEPNDRKIGKLCDYASKNPLRIPKITENLEQRFYKDLRNEHIGSVKVVLAVYRKLLSSCKKQMPLIATSLLGIIQSLLDQTQESEIQVLGCHVLVDFINCQVDTAYMLNLEGFIPKLCQLTQEVGTDDTVLCLRTAGLQALASLVSFMGKHSHVSANFDKIIVVTLENYMEHGTEPGNGDLNGRPFQPDSLEDSIKSSRNGTDIKQEQTALVDTSKSPCYWSQVCLHNMVELAKEATTMRRVLEPFFQIFDSEDYWSQNGLACSVLMYLQSMLEEAGESSHFLLSIMTKHLDNKNIVKQPQKQINIINVTTQLAKTANQQVSVSLTGALIDLVKHLRKCIQSSLEISNTASRTQTLNADLQSAIEDCISQMSCKVGDVGPILDVMAVVLDNLPSSAIVARATMFSAYRVTQIIMSLPNMSYHEDVFPDALFHELLLAMAHSDSETRVGANYCFSLVLVPSPSCPWLCTTVPTCINSLGSSSILPLLRARTRSLTIPNDSQDKTEALDSQSLTESSSFKRDVTKGSKNRTSLKLSGHQISLLLSSIWVQALSTENTPANLIAIAHTYNTVLSFTRPKTSDHMAFELLKLLGFEDGKTSDESQFDLVFVHLGSNGKAANQEVSAAKDTEFMNNLVGEILQTSSQYSAIRSRLHLSLVMSYGAVAEEDQGLLLSSLYDERNSNLSVLFPWQSYAMIGGKFRSNVRKRCPLLVVQWQEAVTRKDNTEIPPLRVGCHQVGLRARSGHCKLLAKACMID